MYVYTYYTGQGQVPETYQQERGGGVSRRGRVTSSERLLFILRRNRMRTEAMGITRREGEEARRQENL